MPRPVLQILTLLLILCNDRQWQKLKIASKVIVSNTKERSTNIGLKEMERNKVLTDVGIVLDHIIVVSF